MEAEQKMTSKVIQALQAAMPHTHPPCWNIRAEGIITNMETLRSAVARDSRYLNYLCELTCVVH